MKIKLSAVLVGAVLLLDLGSLPLTTAADDVNLKSHYGAIMDDLIARCKFNTPMRHSKSEVIRNAAMLSCLKTTFYKKNREALIHAIMTGNIGMKRYKVKYYLNTQFYDLVRSRNKTIAKAYLGN